MPCGVDRFLPVDTVKSVQTLKAQPLDSQTGHCPIPNLGFCPNTEGSTTGQSNWPLTMNSATTLITSHNTEGSTTGQSNWPLRGSKCSIWEGGTKGTGFMYWSGLPRAAVGLRFTGLIHACDWLPTVISALGVSPLTPTDTLPLDGIDMYGACFRQKFILEDAISSHACSLQCDQWHSSRVSTFLTGSYFQLRPNTEGGARCSAIPPHLALKCTMVCAISCYRQIFPFFLLDGD
jgi:hypothetical protein